MIQTTIYGRILTGILFITCCSLLICCKAAHYPICTSLSNTKPSNIDGISQTLFNICQQRNIQITVLSSVIVELKGPIKQMKWLQKNYNIIMCDFDQGDILEDEKAYLTCMANAEKWIKLVQKLNAHDLMIQQSKFDICLD